jgi:hypothetical protein
MESMVDEVCRALGASPPTNLNTFLADRRASLTTEYFAFTSNAENAHGCGEALRHDGFDVVISGRQRRGHDEYVVKATHYEPYSAGVEDRFASSCESYGCQFDGHEHGPPKRVQGQ